MHIVLLTCKYVLEYGIELYVSYDTIHDSCELNRLQSRPLGSFQKTTEN